MLSSMTVYQWAVSLILLAHLMLLVLIGIILYRKRTTVFKVLTDVFTSASGDFDPARLFGYIPILLGVFVFYILAFYDTLHNHAFNYGGFCAGLGSIGGTAVLAASGVWLKSGTEATPLPPSTNATATLLPGIPTWTTGSVPLPPLGQSSGNGLTPPNEGP